MGMICNNIRFYESHFFLKRPVVDERQKSQIEKRKRNLKTISPISRGEREIWISFPQFREEKEKSNKMFSTFEKRKRNQTKCFQLSRRERETYFLCSSFESRKRNLKYLSPISRGEREYWRTNSLISRVEWEKWNSLLLCLDHVLVPRFSSRSKMLEKLSF